MENQNKPILVNLDEDFKASANRLLELKRNRHNDDIPITDEYWKALRKHQLAFGNKEK